MKIFIRRENTKAAIRESRRRAIEVLMIGFILTLRNINMISKLLIPETNEDIY